MKMKLHALSAAIALAMRPVSFDDPPKEIPKELEPLVQAKIDSAVSGLKEKNTELLAEQRKMKDRLKEFEGIDPAAVKAMLQRFGSDEEAKLLAEGKIDEVIQKRTERMQADHVKELEKERGETARVRKANEKLAARTLAHGITQAAIKAGALPEAVEDLTLRAKGSGWTVDDDGELVAKNGDEVVLGKDGKTPLSPTEWAESLRETAPHLWPKAQGSGAPGSGAGPKGSKTIDPALKPEERITQYRNSGAGARA